MSKHIKIIVSVLFIFVIVLVIGITRFNFDVSKDSKNNIDDVEILSTLSIDKYGRAVFKSENELYGVIDKNEKVIIDPVWVELKTVSEKYFIAADDVNNKKLYGLIDNDGNIITPFIYRSIEKFESNDTEIYVAIVEEDNKFVLYDSSLIPVFNRVWEDCSIDNSEIILYHDKNIYTYVAGNQGLAMKNAMVYGVALELDFDINFYSRSLLSKLNYVQIEEIAKNIGIYLEYAFKDDFTNIGAITDIEYYSNFDSCLSDFTNVFYKSLDDIKDISVYQSKTEDGESYITAVVLVDVKYSYMEGEEGIADNKVFKAVLKFKEVDGKIIMFSGDFENDNIYEETIEDETENY